MEKELYNFYLEGEVTFMQVYKVERAQSQDLNPNLDRHGCESWVGKKNPLEEELATHSSILAQEIPWTEEPSRLQS